MYIYVYVCTIYVGVYRTGTNTFDSNSGDDFRNHSLILVCSSAAFATRIRMISQQLLDSFKEEGERGIERIEIRIAPVNRPQPSTRKRKGLSSAAVQALGRFASDSGDADIQAIFDGINARRNR